MWNHINILAITRITIIIITIVTPAEFFTQALADGPFWIVVNEFDLQSLYYVHFRTNTLGKGMRPLSF